MGSKESGVYADQAGFRQGAGRKSGAEAEGGNQAEMRGGNF